MGCAFTLEHYREIIESALRAGYSFQGFHQPNPGHSHRNLYLRHDIDICLEEALNMADLEAELGVHATYFVLLNSPVYNICSQDSIEIIHQIQAKGHWIGLHIDPVVLQDFDASKMEIGVLQLIKFYGSRINLVPVISFHRPNSMILGKDFSSFISTYSERFFKEIKYISDSRGIWREGCPCQILKRGLYPAVQMLVHPIWWGISETEKLTDKLSRLLESRLDCLKGYLGDNIVLFRSLLQKEKN